jgi:hypothetical protein
VPSERGRDGQVIEKWNIAAGSPGAPRFTRLMSHILLGEHSEF